MIQLTKSKRTHKRRNSLAPTPLLIYFRRHWNISNFKLLQIHLYTVEVFRSNSDISMSIIIFLNKKILKIILEMIT